MSNSDGGVIRNMEYGGVYRGGTTIILLLAILLARVLNKKYPMGDAK